MFRHLNFEIKLIKLEIFYEHAKFHHVSTPFFNINCSQNDLLEHAVFEHLSTRAQISENGVLQKVILWTFYIEKRRAQMMKISVHRSRARNQYFWKEKGWQLWKPIALGRHYSGSQILIIVVKLLYWKCWSAAWGRPVVAVRVRTCIRGTRIEGAWKVCRWPKAVWHCGTKSIR